LARRYSTWADVLDYCRQSANPVGRLVLRLNGYHDDRLDAASDAVCTALQLTNFWQDLAIDWSRGRLYVPEEMWRAHHAEVTSLDARQMTSQWKAVLVDCADRTRASCFSADGRCATMCRDGSATSCHLAGRHADSRSSRSRRRYDVFKSRPKLGPPTH
jgi:phytoene/squalene synthetase